MKALLVIMTGIGFTLGVVLGLLLHLPSDSLPAEHSSLLSSNSRHRRSVNVLDVNHVPNDLTQALGDSSSAYDVMAPMRHPTEDKEGKASEEGDNPIMNTTAEKANKAGSEIERGVQRPVGVLDQNGGSKQIGGLLQIEKNQRHGKDRNLVFHGDLVFEQNQEIKSISTDQKDAIDNPSIALTLNGDETKGAENHKGVSDRRPQSPEDSKYLKSLVQGVLWTDKLEHSCPRAFKSAETESWRTKAESLDVVKMEEGCGRMQNRLLTFRDASRACARYRLNTDQIQGEIFSYYLAKLLNISNLPPTSLALVNSVDQKWRTVHLDLSLAQWADSKLVVLTQYIEGLEAAHIPQDFREDHRQLHPILAHLGTKSRSELCELVQWSDLIVFDYLTANLDRVINNMFNRQWNDQIMESPAHNLEKFKDGSLVFLDNESGLFHGFRLIDKYESLHRALLDSLCIFRSSTASAIKRLATSGSVGTELRALLQQHEPLYYRHLAMLPQKNLKILQRRIERVSEQISKCEKMFKS